MFVATCLAAILMESAMGLVNELWDIFHFLMQMHLPLSSTSNVTARAVDAPARAKVNNLAHED